MAEAQPTDRPTSGIVVYLNIALAEMTHERDRLRETVKKLRRRVK